MESVQEITKQKEKTTKSAPPTINKEAGESDIHTCHLFYLRHSLFKKKNFSINLKIIKYVLYQVNKAVNINSLRKKRCWTC